jgi:hypothetical protein
MANETPIEMKAVRSVIPPHNIFYVPIPKPKQ